MRLIELDPRWIEKDGRRVGFLFVSPANSHWRQSCFVEKVPRAEQEDLFSATLGVPRAVQGCNPGMAWAVEGGIENATFETLTVTPSIDGSAGGLWHGFIHKGEVA